MVAFSLAYSYAVGAMVATPPPASISVPQSCKIRLIRQWHIAALPARGGSATSYFRRIVRAIQWQDMDAGNHA
jgi:hypothetical protein